MQVFISWSGEKSKAVAAALHEWIPMLIQSVKPWFSPEDIEKGSRWLQQINTQLEVNSVGILCITKASAKSPWLLFEAGALSKAIESSWVCPVLLGIEPTEISGPLAQFQVARANKDDIRKLVETINSRTDNPLAPPNLEKLYELLWPQLEGRLIEAAQLEELPQQATRSQDDILKELLERTRAIERKLSEQETEASLTLNSTLLELYERISQIASELAFLNRQKTDVDMRLRSLQEGADGERRELLLTLDRLATQEAKAHAEQAKLFQLLKDFQNRSAHYKS